MKTSIDCIPCFVRQTLEAARFVSDYVSVHEGVLREILRSLAGIDLDLPPPLIGQRMHRNLREIMGNEDPYREVKRRHNHLALSLLPELKQMVRNSPDPLKTSVLLAISGNVIDLGTNSGLTEDEVRSSITRSLSEPLRMNIEDLRKETEKASSILYLADNAGEIVFDRLLIERLPLRRVTVVVRGAPIINDVLIEDAHTAGLDEIVRVIGNGSDAPGTVLDDCNREFHWHYKAADLVIAKGQGNYEALSDEKKNIFFLFRVKCATVESHVGFKVGTNALTRATSLRRSKHTSS
ncbi:MAG: ARMT1-like domain-containing protein [Syntrophorhabdaceae bacterium]|nr:ARMT1-like domain-containing protein [Syntrophorhabdaceae bacterium]MDD4195702.1 ARMT1-like domain-containing protein [Syntrophorhabdaceae bacterium]